MNKICFTGILSAGEVENMSKEKEKQAIFRPVNY
jgi:hypothetical protein